MYIFYDLLMIPNKIYAKFSYFNVYYMIQLSLVANLLRTVQLFFNSNCHLRQYEENTQVTRQEKGVSVVFYYYLVDTR